MSRTYHAKLSAESYGAGIELIDPWDRSITVHWFAEQLRVGKPWRDVVRAYVTALHGHPWRERVKQIRREIGAKWHCAESNGDRIVFY